MNLNRKDVKKIRGLILFTAVVILALIKFDLLWEAFVFCIQIVKPFILGAAIAFVINLPMRFFENKFFSGEKAKPKTKRVLDKLKRPVSMVMSYVVVLLVIALVMITVIPQIAATIKVLAKEIPVFLENTINYLEVMLAANPEVVGYLSSIEIPQIDWQKTIQDIFGFLQNGMGNVLTSTFSVASNIASGAVNFFIAVVFSVYVLSQKEKLGNQFGRVVKAYTKPAVYEWCMKVAGLLYRNFSHFITGQCTEAVILGAMFIVVMAIFRFPFAIMIGVLIAFTALIPVVGAFIGCFIGAFLILVDSPTKALGFLILFLILQQVEGNLIYPHVVGNSVGLPSMWVLAAVTIGGSLMGVVGMLIFIPLLSTVYLLLKEDVNQRNNQKDGKDREKGKEVKTTVKNKSEGE
ncbi:MAG: AI-2E family transporter [Lachnospiraceae bacterium]|nr:AI-2E family transporter [Lachnospiraceae bacterium]